MKLEFQRNRERYEFMKWGMQALIPLVWCRRALAWSTSGPRISQHAGCTSAKNGVYYPDTLVGTDSHTTMINGIGVVGWGVGGIEAEAAMLGQPISSRPMWWALSSQAAARRRDGHRPGARP